MSSYDEWWRIERYPVYDGFGGLDSLSYGCPILNLMGYNKIEELFEDMKQLIKAKEITEFHKFVKEKEGEQYD